MALQISFASLPLMDVHNQTLIQASCASWNRALERLRAEVVCAETPTVVDTRAVAVARGCVCSERPSLCNGCRSYAKRQREKSAPRPFAEIANEAVGVCAGILEALAGNVSILGELLEQIETLKQAAVSLEQELASKCEQNELLSRERDQMRKQNLALQGELTRQERAADKDLVTSTFALTRQASDAEGELKAAAKREERLKRHVASLQRDKEDLQMSREKDRWMFTDGIRNAKNDVARIERALKNEERQHNVDVFDWRKKLELIQVASDLASQKVARLELQLEHARNKHEETLEDLGHELEKSASTEQANARLRKRISRLRTSFNAETEPGPHSASNKKTSAARRALKPSTIADVVAFLERTGQKHAEFWSRAALTCTSCDVSANMAPILLGALFTLLGVVLQPESIPAPTFFLRTETVYAVRLRASKKKECLEHRAAGGKFFSSFDGSPFGGGSNIQAANLQCVGVAGKTTLIELDAYDLADGTAATQLETLEKQLKSLGLDWTDIVGMMSDCCPAALAVLELVERLRAEANPAIAKLLRLTCSVHLAGNLGIHVGACIDAILNESIVPLLKEEAAAAIPSQAFNKAESQQRGGWFVRELTTVASRVFKPKSLYSDWCEKEKEEAHFPPDSRGDHYFMARISSLLFIHCHRSHYVKFLCSQEDSAVRSKTAAISRDDADHVQLKIILRTDEFWMVIQLASLFCSAVVWPLFICASTCSSALELQGDLELCLRGLEKYAATPKALLVASETPLPHASSRAATLKGSSDQHLLRLGKKAQRALESGQSVNLARNALKELVTKARLTVDVAYGSYVSSSITKIATKLIEKMKSLIGAQLPGGASYNHPLLAEVQGHNISIERWFGKAKYVKRRGGGSNARNIDRTNIRFSLSSFSAEGEQVDDDRVGRVQPERAVPVPPGAEAGQVNLASQPIPSTPSDSSVGNMSASKFATKTTEPTATATTTKILKPLKTTPATMKTEGRRTSIAQGTRTESIRKRAFIDLASDETASSDSPAPSLRDVLREDKKQKTQLAAETDAIRKRNLEKAQKEQADREEKRRTTLAACIAADIAIGDNIAAATAKQLKSAIRLYRDFRGCATEPVGKKQPEELQRILLQARTEFNSRNSTNVPFPAAPRTRSSRAQTANGAATAGAREAEAKNRSARQQTQARRRRMIPNK